MDKSKVTHLVTPHHESRPTEIKEHPIDAARLQIECAIAIIDMIHTPLVCNDIEDVKILFFDQLCPETLGYALHAVLEQLRTALAKIDSSANNGVNHA